MTLVPIVEEQISKLVLTIVAAINDLLGTSIVLTPEEVIDANNRKCRNIFRDT